MDASNISMQRLKDFWHERATLSGLIVFLLVLNGSLGPTVFWLYGALKDLERFKDSETSLLLFVAIMAILVVANALLFTVWFYWRSLPRFQSHENAILFAPHYDSECGTLVQSIFERLVYELERRVPEGSISPLFCHLIKKSRTPKRLIVC